MTSPSKPAAKPRKSRAKKAPQEEFIEAAVKKTMNVELEILEEDGKTSTKILTLKRWTLRQQFTEGAKLQKVVRSIIVVLSSVGEKIETFTPSQALKDPDMVMSILAAQAEDIFSLITTALASNFNSLQECQDFVDNKLQPQDSLILLFSLIALNKAVETESSKKKLEGLSETLSSLLK